MRTDAESTINGIETCLYEGNRLETDNVDERPRRPRRHAEVHNRHVTPEKAVHALSDLKPEPPASPYSEGDVDNIEWTRGTGLSLR